MRVPGAAVQPPEVLLDEVVGRRPDDAGVDHQVLEIAHPGLLLEQPHGRAFDVKAAHGAALGQGLLGGRIIFRFPAVFVEIDLVGMHVMQWRPGSRPGCGCPADRSSPGRRFPRPPFPIAGWARPLAERLDRHIIPNRVRA